MGCHQRSIFLFVCKAQAMGVFNRDLRLFFNPMYPGQKNSGNYWRELLVTILNGNLSGFCIFNIFDLISFSLFKASPLDDIISKYTKARGLLKQYTY
jgi:hypothetical protein